MDTPPRPDPVAHRALVIGDSHGSRPMVREALRAAGLLGADVVVSVGDFGIWPGSHGKQFLDVVETMAAARGLEVLAVPGNHDDYDQLAAAPTDDAGLMVLRDRLRAAPRGQVVTFGRFRWLLCGGAASIDGPGGIWRQGRGPADEPVVRADASGRTRLYPAGHDLGSWWPQERITDADVDACRAATAAAGGRVEVLITHEAPAEVALSSSHKPVEPGAWPDGDDQRSHISQVRTASGAALQVCGHWHQHVVHRDEAGAVAVLSADVEPRQPQWLVIDDDARFDTPVARLPRIWDAAMSLTSATRGRHRVAADLSDGDLRLL